MNNCILKSLSVENFASFADKIQFTTLIDSRKKDTTDFTMCINDELYNKVSYIYGANGSGKTFFCKILREIQRLIDWSPLTAMNNSHLLELPHFKGINSTVPHFAFDVKYENEPTSFGIEIVVDKIYYHYNFSVFNQKVIYERLTKKYKRTEKLLERTTSSYKDIVLKSELKNLYYSLCKQTNYDFRWLVVDDGSRDETDQYIEKIKREPKFKIEYIKKANGGKHTALNTGVKQIKTELTMIVDSDDCLLPDAIEIISGIYSKYKDNMKIGSFTFLKIKSDGKAVVSLEENELVANYIKYRIKENRPGDMAEVFRTNVLKENQFPEFPNERFLSEDVCWIEIGKKYDSVYINKAIYECEYLQEGLTSNDKPMKFQSPCGSMARGKELMSRECGLKANIKGAIIYNCYRKCLVTEVPKCLELSILNRILVIVTIPLGNLFYKKWKNEKNKSILDKKM